MAIYGTALLAISLLIGSIIGKWLGYAIGVQANVGGVGIAMILLILLSDRLRRSGRMTKPSEQGVVFWSSIYIPVVVAMAASQNVYAAFNGGLIAMLAGAGAVLICFAMVPVVSRLGGADPPSAQSRSGDQP